MRHNPRTLRNSEPFAREIGYDGSGYYVEIYTDNDGASGYGDSPMVGRWYGDRAQCEALDPRKVELRPMRSSRGPDPFDVACERRFD